MHIKLIDFMHSNTFSHHQKIVTTFANIVQKIFLLAVVNRINFNVPRYQWEVVKALVNTIKLVREF